MLSPLPNLSRRRFLVGTAGVLGTALFAGRYSRASASPSSQVVPSSHNVWVWQFNEDGDAESIRDVLASHGLGILLKTHDGTRWMKRWDNSPFAIEGGTSILKTARFFENAAVPFHAWCVVQGQDPMEEARMCAEVLRNGARSLTFDLEPPEEGHYWQAGSGEAVAFGKELRRLVPDARLSVAPDPRPWQLESVPMREFAAFSNEIAPQTYWDIFSSSANYRLLRERGYEVGDEGVTPELILDVSQRSLGAFGRPIRPIGQGNSASAAWQRFVGHARKLGMADVSVWRYGTLGSGVLPVLGNQQATNQNSKTSSFSSATATSLEPPGIIAARSAQLPEASRSAARANADSTSFHTDWENLATPDSLQDEGLDSGTTSNGSTSTSPSVSTTPTDQTSEGTGWKWSLPERLPK